MTFTFTAIGQVHTCYAQKFGIPRQSGLSPSAEARIEIYPPYNRIEAFDGLQTASHIWLQFVFHENKRQQWKPKVKAPRLGGNKTIGVFATRSPVRPNPIGLSVVRLEQVIEEQGKLFIIIRGGDFLDKTPILDIKPYVPYCDALSDATNTFADSAPVRYPVIFVEDIRAAVIASAVKNFQQLIIETLEINPSPQYQKLVDGKSKVFVVRLYHFDISWQIVGNEIHVIGFEDLNSCP